MVEAGSTPTGQSLQRTGDAPTDWTGPESATPGEANDGSGPGEPRELLISQIQGTGSASLFDGDYVLVSAMVTYTVDNGFFLQEEATDADGNVLTSEGIFVFTGGSPSVSAGDLVEVTGTVDEFSGLTEITNLVSINTVSSGNALPDFADVTVPLATADALERFEGMRISLTSGTTDRLTVIENFNLDRFGEITLSAGDQYQPTQLFDPDTDAAAIARADPGECAQPADHRRRRFEPESGRVPLCSRFNRRQRQRLSRFRRYFHCRRSDACGSEPK